MNVILKTLLSSAATSVLFTGVIIAEIVYQIFKTANNQKSKKKKVFCIGISCVLVCLWAVLMTTTYSFSDILAYYEYSNSVVEEKVGVINQKEQTDSCHMLITIDNTNYTMAYSNDHPLLYKDIRRGHTVTFKYGKNSKYIFEIYESE